MAQSLKAVFQAVTLCAEPCARSAEALQVGEREISLCTKHSVTLGFSAIRYYTYEDFGPLAKKRGDVTAKQSGRRA